jgi:hypothetical protein
VGPSPPAPPRFLDARRWLTLALAVASALMALGLGERSAHAAAASIAPCQPGVAAAERLRPASGLERLRPSDPAEAPSRVLALEGPRASRTAPPSRETHAADLLALGRGLNAASRARPRCPASPRPSTLLDRIALLMVSLD